MENRTLQKSRNKIPPKKCYHKIETRNIWKLSFKYNFGRFFFYFNNFNFHFASFKTYTKNQKLVEYKDNKIVTTIRYI